MQTRMPFRYGIATVTSLPHIFVRLTVEIEGKTYHGLAADHLAPKWFTKNPESAPEDDIAEMLMVVRQALSFAEGLTAETPFALWRSLYDQQAAWGKAQGLAPLLTNFGVTFVERALIDAFCHAEGKPFAALLRENALGIRLGDLHPELGDAVPADLLPTDIPLSSVLARHTVGLSDPLTDADIAEADRLQDGLPQSLQACIRHYGLRHFKLKIGGNPVQDAARLGAILSTIAANVSTDDWAFSLDGNESYQSLEALRTFWDAAVANPEIAPHWSHLLFVEQPLHRNIALAPEIKAAFAAWPDHPPIIIDESDADLTSLPTALSLGYAGTSHKNCKGVFKGIGNACLLAHRRRTNPDTPYLLSGEDLSNVGPVALLEDLAVQAALGIESIERNGQHYFAGLSMYSEAVQQQALAAHPDLYRASPQGFPTLAIANGRLDLGTINAAPFGLGFTLDVAAIAEKV
jgi:hypothetical protein